MPMNANKELIQKEEVYQIVGAAIEVLNGLVAFANQRFYLYVFSRALTRGQTGDAGGVRFFTSAKRRLASDGSSRAMATQ